MEKKNLIKDKRPGPLLGSLEYFRHCSFSLCVWVPYLSLSAAQNINMFYFSAFLGQVFRVSDISDTHNKYYIVYFNENNFYHCRIICPEYIDEDEHEWMLRGKFIDQNMFFLWVGNRHKTIRQRRLTEQSWTQ